MNRRAIRAVMTAVMAVTIIGVVAVSHAAVACGARSTKAAFAAWGDGNQYFRVPGGGFEPFGGNAWTLSGFALTTLGNEPWRVVAPLDASNVMLPSTGTATSPTFCVASAEDSLRMFVRKPGIPGAILHVNVHVTSGNRVATNDVDIDGAGFGWAPSDRIPLPDIRDVAGRQDVTITLSVRGWPATWLVDDVMVDPWRTF